MITFTDFLNKWNGKQCEMGGSANAMFQCVDIVNAWIAEYGEPIVLWTNAQDFPTKISKNFKYILNTPTGVPQQGDIIVWKSPDKIGHIAICSTATSTKFVSFDQNWPVGSVCKLVNHVYTGTYEVMGWLRYEKQIDYPALLAEKDKQILTLTNKVNELEVQMVEVKNALAEIKSNFIEKDKEALKWQRLNDTANTKLSEQILKNEELDKLAKDNKNLYLKKNDDFNNLNKIFEEYKKTHPDEIVKFNIISFIKSLFKK